MKKQIEYEPSYQHLIKSVLGTKILCPLCDTHLASLYHTEKHKETGYHYWCEKCKHGWYIADLQGVTSARLQGKSTSGIRDTIKRSVFTASLETGIPKNTIYRLIRDDKIEVANCFNPIVLEDNEMEELYHLAKARERRATIYEYALSKGKTKTATKKWLQRHRDLPEDKFNKEFSLWLES